MFTCYISASLGETVVAKIVLFDWHAVEIWGSVGLPPEKPIQATSSTTSENAFLALSNIVVLIMNLHAKEEKLVVDKIYTLHRTPVNHGDNAPIGQCLRA